VKIIKREEKRLVQFSQEYILKDIKKFAKRQMTWFKRDKRIKWIKNQSEAEKLVKEFLKEYPTNR